MAGQLIKRGERTWLVRVFMGRDPLTGKRKYHNKTIHGNKKDAQRYLNGVLREKDLGRFCEPSKLTLNEYLDRWLADAVKPRVRERTHYDYSAILRSYVREGLGPLKLHQIGALDVQGLYSGLLERGLSVVTVRKLHTILGSAFKQAVKWEFIAVNPMVNVELPRDKSSRREEKMKIMPLDRVPEFLEAARVSRWGVVFALALGTGMRPGEYLALKWSDLNRDEGVVRVQRTLYRPMDRGGWMFQPPKTSSSVRSISLPGQLVEDLCAHQVEQTREFGEDQELMFTTGGGQPLFSANLRRRHFKPLVEELGMNLDLNLYSMRHTHATMLLSAGVHPKVVAERLGHASVRMTLDVYSHVVPSMQKGLAQRIESMLY